MNRTRTLPCFSGKFVFVSMLCVVASVLSQGASAKQNLFFSIEWEQPVLVDQGSNPSIAVSRNGEPRIAYAKPEGATESVRLAQQGDSLWLSEEVFVADAIHAVRLTLDQFDIPSVAFVYGATDCGFAIRVDTEQWNPSLLGKSGTDLDLAQDALGNPSIAISLTQPSSGVGRVFYDRSVWYTETFQNNIESGFGVSLFFDESNTLHCAYCDAAAQSLKYSWKVHGQNWRTETVFSDASARFFFPQIQVDAEGTVHLVYCRQEIGAEGADVGYARKEGSTWSSALELVSDQGVGFLQPGQKDEPVSLALDPGGRPWLAMRPMEGDLLLSLWNGAFWESVAFSRSGDRLLSEYHVSLALDSQGNAHLACSFSEDGGQSRVYYFKGVLKSVPHSTDYNQDGVVDEKDLMMLLPGWGH